MPDSTTESASAAAANHNDDAGEGVSGVSAEQVRMPTRYVTSWQTHELKMIFQNKKRHNSGAADLEKVTDYAEEKEILSTSTDLDDAIAVIRRLNHLLALVILN